MLILSIVRKLDSKKQMIWFILNIRQNMVESWYPVMMILNVFMRTGRKLDDNMLASCIYAWKISASLSEL